MTNLAEPRSLRMQQPQVSLQLRLQDPVLGNQLLIPQQQFLFHGRGEMRQDARRPLPGCGKLPPDLLYHNSHSTGRANRLGFQNS